MAPDYFPAVQNLAHLAEQDGDIDKTVQKHYRVEDKFKVRITLQHQAMAHVLSDPCSALWLERL